MYNLLVFFWKYVFALYYTQPSSRMGHLSINMENRKSVLKNSNLRKDNESQVYPSPLGFEI